MSKKSITVNYIVKALISVSLGLIIFRRNSELCLRLYMSYKRLNKKHFLFDSSKTVDFKEGLYLMEDILGPELGPEYVSWLP